MRSLFVLAGVATLAVGQLVAQKPDFTGNWGLNTEKSDPAPSMGPRQGSPGGQPGGGMGTGGMGRATSLYITQLENKLMIEQKAGDQSRVVTFYLDGQDSKNPGVRGQEFVTRSHWQGDTLVTEGENKMNTPMGEVSIKSREERTLSANGKSMTIVSMFTTPRGETKRTVVYDKQ